MREINNLVSSLGCFRFIFWLRGTSIKKETKKQSPGLTLGNKHHKFPKRKLEEHNQEEGSNTKGDSLGNNPSWQESPLSCLPPCSSTEA